MSRWHPDPLHVFVSRRVVEDAGLPDSLRALLGPVRGTESLSPNSSRAVAVVAYASDVLRDFSEQGQGFLRGLVSDRTRYLLIEESDGAPVPGLMWLPSHLRLHRPERRLHLTCDVRSFRRLLVAQYRDNPLEGIVDAYLLGNVLNLVLGDLRLESIPIDEIPKLRRLDAEERASFSIDPDGSYIHFEGPDLHYGAANLLELVDPEWRAEREIERVSRDWTGPALEKWRRELGLRQADIGGLSERQVRRIERQVSTLTLDSARRFAEAFERPLVEFLDELASRARRLREREGGAVEEGETVPGPIVETIDLAA